MKRECFGKKRDSDSEKKCVSSYVEYTFFLKELGFSDREEPPAHFRHPPLHPKIRVGRDIYGKASLFRQFDSQVEFI
ncbi:hypothetical protein DLM75_16120 [Leptospira stimsonii]|uniref:Uncharacterized protein n=1 Tax=Leptospira stimsonii TaxID=2202203 RepID=A0A396Z1F4_9LEPT|nr:hypothetical protein DLM75_16120 [Leptospira stimsonii]